MITLSDSDPSPVQRWYRPARELPGRIGGVATTALNGRRRSVQDHLWKSTHIYETGAGGVVGRSLIELGKPEPTLLY
jgi:hypothetical protein